MKMKLSVFPIQVFVPYKFYTIYGPQVKNLYLIYWSKNGWADYKDTERFFILKRGEEKAEMKSLTSNTHTLIPVRFAKTGYKVSLGFQVARETVLYRSFPALLLIGNLFPEDPRHPSIYCAHLIQPQPTSPASSKATVPSRPAPPSQVETTP